MNVGRFIHNSQKAGSNSSVHQEGMNKQAVVFPYNGFTRMGHKGKFRVMEILYIFMVMVVH